GETDDTVNKKLHALVEYGITPIVCVGETLTEHEAGQTQDVVLTQVRKAFANIKATDAVRVVVAYEPIWAIGTGKSDNPGNANKTIHTIRETVGKLMGDDVAGAMRILYGGSMNAGNVDAFMAQHDIDGGLVGGASLKADSFLRIVHFETPAVSAS
ncbi:MAG: triose-phosphate isomerase family protein, partial [Candidatus Xenobia bacterium]